MTGLKTKQTEINVVDFIHSFTNDEQKKQDSFDLIKLMSEVSGFEPKMWGPSIIGFGKYHYKYESGHEGEIPLVSFSPRKAAISLYVYSNTPKQALLLEKLGKYKMGKMCIYINRLTDIDIEILKEMMIDSIEDTKMKYG